MILESALGNLVIEILVIYILAIALICIAIALLIVGIIFLIRKIIKKKKEKQL